MSVNLYNHRHYRDFLLEWMAAQPNGGRGLRSQLAKVIGTQTGFITQVFNGVAEFSLEQGLKIAEWIGLIGKDRDYFLLLLSYDRASTKDLREYFESQIQKLIDERKVLSQRLDVR